MSAIGLALWQAVELSSLSSVAERVETVKPHLSAFRLAVIGLLALTWPRLPALWTGACGDDRQAYERWMALRWRVVVCLFVIESVLGQSLVGRFLSAISSFPA
ncbi:MAG: hypothetical protein RLQ73_03260 [Hoeflea sp. D1-CHI-28]